MWSCSFQGAVRRLSWLACCDSGVRALASVILLVGLAQPSAGKVELLPETTAAFDKYAEEVERQFSGRLDGTAPFLWTTERKERVAALLDGRVVVEPLVANGSTAISGGLIHDWIAAVLVPVARAEQVVGVVTAYDSHARTYAPAILRSQILSRDGRKLHVAIRMIRSAGLTAVLDTEHLAEYDRLDSGRWWGRSRSTRIREVLHAGTAREKLSPEGYDNGYLWRLHAYWRFAERPEGVAVEYRTVTLTRGIPSGLRWMLRPVLSHLPRASLRTVMQVTRDTATARHNPSDRTDQPRGITMGQ